MYRISFGKLLPLQNTSSSSVTYSPHAKDQVFQQVSRRTLMLSLKHLPCLFNVSWKRQTRTANGLGSHHPCRILPGNASVLPAGLLLNCNHVTWTGSWWCGVFFEFTFFFFRYLDTIWRNIFFVWVVYIVNSPTSTLPPKCTRQKLCRVHSAYKRFPVVIDPS